MVHDALHDLPLGNLDVLFIENVGNLVCPASFDLGQHRNVTLLSVPEGDDKPAKYPVMFRAADLSLITKTDLLAYITEFKLARARAALRQIGFGGETIELSNAAARLRRLAGVARARGRRTARAHRARRDGATQHSAEGASAHATGQRPLR